jgi:hypothetical protein
LCHGTRTDGCPAEHHCGKGDFLEHVLSPVKAPLWALFHIHAGCLHKSILMRREFAVGAPSNDVSLTNPMK